MAWWIGILEYRRRGAIVAGVTMVHVLGLTAILSHVFQTTAPTTRSFLEIELAEIEPPPPPDPDPVLQSEAIEVPVQQTPEPLPSEAPPMPVPTQAPSSQEPPAVTPETQSVLTQLDQSATGTLSGQATEMPSIGESEGTVTPAQIASVLKQADCLKLKRHDEDVCPKPDPFAVAIASAERAIPPERLFGDPRYIAKTVSDKVFEEEAANRFLWPDEDLFADPMSPGAYNARRIRNGQEPLWSKEMRDGFTNRD